MACCGYATWWAKISWICVMLASLFQVVAWSTPSWMIRTPYGWDCGRHAHALVCVQNHRLIYFIQERLVCSHSIYHKTQRITFVSLLHHLFLLLLVACMVGCVLLTIHCFFFLLTWTRRVSLVLHSVGYVNECQNKTISPLACRSGSSGGA
jgi:hypothetical protein